LFLFFTSFLSSLFSLSLLLDLSFLSAFISFDIGQGLSQWPTKFILGPEILGLVKHVGSVKVGALRVSN
jgi:hypothetical protein